MLMLVFVDIEFDAGVSAVVVAERKLAVGNT